MDKIEINLDKLKLDLARMGWGVDEVMAINYAVKYDDRIKAVERVVKTKLVIDDI
jgi:hypothetical protein